MKEYTTEYSCPYCRSKNIEEQVVVWVDPNTGNVTDSDWSVVPWGEERYCCNDCDRNFGEADQRETRVPDEIVERKENLEQQIKVLEAQTISLEKALTEAQKIAVLAIDDTARLKMLAREGL